MKILAVKPQLTPLGTFWNEEAHCLRIPTIQRQFVWDAEDVRDLIDSIVNGYPIGAIIIWEPTTEFPSAPLLGGDEKDTRRYVLDGQQRLTALSLLMNGGWQIQRGINPFAHLPSPTCRKTHAEDVEGFGGIV